MNSDLSKHVYIVIGGMSDHHLGVLLHQLERSCVANQIVLVEHEPSRVEECFKAPILLPSVVDIAKVAFDCNSQPDRPGYVHPRQSFRRNGRK